jgi:hypothetical protein
MPYHDETDRRQVVLPAERGLVAPFDKLRVT